MFSLIKVSLQSNIGIIQTTVFSVKVEPYKIKNRKNLYGFDLWCGQRHLRLPFAAKKTNKGILDHD